MPRENLEKVIKEKVEPLVEGLTQKYLGVTISELNKDITDKIEKNPLLSYDINTVLPFKTAKKLFKKEFFTKLIKTHYGNVSAIAKILGIDRRSIHRTIKELNINIKQARQEMLRPDYYTKEAVDSILRKVLDNYKEIIHPEKFERIYKSVPALTKEIVQEMPEANLTLKEAEEEFEKVYLAKALQEHDNALAETAKAIKLRYETLLRKLKKLGIK